MEDNRPRIGLDVDGVLAAFSPKFISMANAKYGLHLKPEDQHGWAHQSLGLSDEQADAIWQDIERTPNWWLSLDQLPGTHDLSAWYKRYRIYFITSRTLSAGLPVEDQTANWIRRHYFIPNPTVLVSSNKGPLCAALNIEYFLDDRPENCTNVRAYSPFTKVFIQHAPYNVDFPGGSIERVPSLNEFFLRVREIGGINGSTKQAA